MNRFFYILLFLFCSTGMFAQNITVSDFYLDEKDLTANQQGTMVMDQNGEKCALLRIQTTQTGFSFDIGSLGVTEIRQKTGELWVYIPHGARKMSIRHDQLGSLIDYAFPVSINKANTYVMRLTTGEVHTIVKSVIRSQYVLFELEPKNAMVELNGQTLETADGTATKRMPFGEYSYRVQAPRYEQFSGIVSVNDPKNKHVVQVSLTPAFQNITFKAKPGTEIWIDNVQKGVGIYTGELSFGTYLVETRKEGHRSAEKEVIISRGQKEYTFNLPEPTPIYGSLDINSTPANADIIIDGQKVGTTPLFIEEYLVGHHVLELYKDGYEVVTKNIIVSKETIETVTCIMKKQNVRQVSVPLERKATKNIDSLLKEAKNGDKDAQNTIAGYYFSGFKLEQNYKEAFFWYKKAAEQGQSSAQYFLGVCYEKGLGVEKDIAVAKRWYRIASTKDNDARRAIERLENDEY